MSVLETENRDIALRALRELSEPDGTTDDRVRLEAAQALLYADSGIADAVEQVIGLEERLTAVEKAVGRRRLARVKVET